jgi:hypothetical protein
MRRLSKPGDLWMLGPHRLLCGDARSVGRHRRKTSIAHFASRRPDCLAGHVDGVSGLVAAVSGPLGG